MHAIPKVRVRVSRIRVMVRVRASVRVSAKGLAAPFHLRGQMNQWTSDYKLP